ncbi:MAG: hypothetical protein IT233_12545 [Bacteroidia bacterium]|nr:hypothetical protein [Bacteroidia bacterium]
MAKEQEIQKFALQILSENPQGLRYTDLRNAIWAKNNDFNRNTINGSIWDLDTTFPKEVYKPARGIFRLVSFRESDSTPQKIDSIEKPIKKGINEETFYQPFADWLINDLDECTKAIPVGGAVFRDKWSTPDVIGIRQHEVDDIIRFPIEIVSAEIKIDSNELIKAFGQACSYKVFSHKSYIAVPKDSSPEDVDRLDVLSQLFGIGLVLFDSSSPDSPRFEIRCRAVKSEPDMFYVNKYLKLIKNKLFKH